MRGHSQTHPSTLMMAGGRCGTVRHGAVRHRGAVSRCGVAVGRAVGWADRFLGGDEWAEPRPPSRRAVGGWRAERCGRAGGRAVRCRGAVSWCGVGGVAVRHGIRGRCKREGVVGDTNRRERD